jgi:hypothetical protein
MSLVAKLKRRLMMKKGYKVGLFFVLLTMAFVGGIIWTRHIIGGMGNATVPDIDIIELENLNETEETEPVTACDTVPVMAGFYILETDGEIIVLKGDMATLYFRTGLNPESLPYDVRMQVQRGKYLESELEVYHFLESYSS